VVLPRADVVVGFDLPRHVVMDQVIRRTLHRTWHHEVLWNGNQESLRNVLRWDPHKSIIRWSWTNYYAAKERADWFERLVPSYGATFVRVRSHAEATERLSDLGDVDLASYLV
jgi:hypothetical protein